MKLVTVDGARYWLPDDGVPTVARALGGPFDTNAAAYWWLIGYLEERFTGAKKALWADAVAQMGDGGDVAHLMGLAMMVAAGHSREHVLRAAWPIQWPQRPDYRARAAGEREAA
jgi:hypothetical protein